MKHTIQLLIILFTSSVHYHSHTAQTTIDCSSAKNQLTQDYKNYLREQINLYKNESIKISSLIEMGKIMGTEQRSYIRDAQNHDGDTLLHVAVAKEDLPVIQDIFAFSSTTHQNAQGKKPLDLAIEQLHPKSIESRNNNQVVILEVLANRIAERAYLESDKTECLQKLITLELACKNNPTQSFSFVPNATLLHKLIPNEHQINSEQFLANIYKETIDNETGNTFAHVCVHQEDPDELFKLVCTNRISDLPNKQNLNAFECALCNFRAFTSQAQLIDAKNDTFNRVRCCYFILYYYYTKNLTNSCCEKHRIPAKQ